MKKGVDLIPFRRLYGPKAKLQIFMLEILGTQYWLKHATQQNVEYIGEKSLAQVKRTCSFDENTIKICVPMHPKNPAPQENPPHTPYRAICWTLSWARFSRVVDSHGVWGFSPFEFSCENRFRCSERLFEKNDLGKASYKIYDN